MGNPGLKLCRRIRSRRRPNPAPRCRRLGSWTMFCGAGPFVVGCCRSCVLFQETAAIRHVVRVRGCCENRSRCLSTSPPPPIQEFPAPDMNVPCPHCQVRLSVHPSQAGGVIACPKCGGKFQIPLPIAQVETGHLQTAQSVPTEVQAFASKKIAAGICGILLGGLGVHKFILGLNTSGVIMLAIWLAGWITGMCIIVPLVASCAMSVIGLVEGIMYLTKTDEEFYQTYAIQKREWF